MNRIYLLLMILALSVAASAQTLMAMSPRNVSQNTQMLTLNISGSKFRKGMKAYLGSTQLQTKIINQYRLTASVPSSYLTTAGIYPVKVNSSNAMNLQVCAPLVIPPQTPPAGTVGTPYSFQLTASGGCQPNP
jgi:hypothetical protein